MQSLVVLVNKLLLGQWVPNFTSELSSTPQFTPPILGITKLPNKWLREKLSVSCSVFILLRRRTIFFVKTQRPGEGGGIQKSSQFNYIYGLRAEMRFVKQEMWHTAVFFFSARFRHQEFYQIASWVPELKLFCGSSYLVWKSGSPYVWSWQSSSWHQLRSAIPWVKEIPFMFLESCFHCCLGGEKQEYKCLCVKIWEPGSVFSLAKYNFTLRYFVCSTTQNILWEQSSPLSLYLWVF